MEIPRHTFAAVFFFAAALSENISAFEEKFFSANFDAGDGPRITPIYEVCNKPHEDGMEILMFIKTDKSGRGCTLEEYSYSITDGEDFNKFSSYCNKKTQCNFDLPNFVKLRQCEVKIIYECIQKDLGPPTTVPRKPSTDKAKETPSTSGSPSTKGKDIDSPVPDDKNRGDPRPEGEVDGESDDKERGEGDGDKEREEGDGDKAREEEDGDRAREEEESNQLNTISVVAIVLGCTVVITLAVIAVLCGLLVCGRNSRVGARAGGFHFHREQQHQNGQCHQPVPLDEYAYIDESRLLSESKACSSSPSTAQPHGQQQACQKVLQTVDKSRGLVRGSKDPSRVVPPRDDYADYAEVSDGGDAVDSAERQNTHVVLLTAAYQVPRGSVKTKPQQIGGHYNSVAVGGWPPVSAPCTAAVVSSTEAVEYSVPKTKAQWSETVAPSKSPVPVPLPKPIKSNSKKYSCAKVQTTPRPEVPVAPSPSFSRKSPPLRPAPSLPCAARSRRASLPRHSKLMENNADERADVILSSQQPLYSKLSSRSQPSLLTGMFGQCTTTDVLYSHLGDPGAQTVSGNVYNDARARREALRYDAPNQEHEIQAASSY